MDPNAIIYPYEFWTNRQTLKELNRRGYVKAEVVFSGGGDEGGVDNIRLHSADGNVHTLQTTMDYSFEASCYNNTRTGPSFVSRTPLTEEQIVDNQLERNLSAPIHDRFGSLAGEYFVSGTVLWDVALGICHLEGHESNDIYDSWDDDEDEGEI